MSILNNRENFIWRSDAFKASKLIVPMYASKATIHKDDGGWWLNVYWHCGAIAPLTIQEYHQANEGKEPC